VIEFHSIGYLVFLLLVFCLYWKLDSKFQNSILLISSLIFYGSWDAAFLLLLLATASFDFFAARAIDNARSSSRRKIFLFFSITANLSILGYLKYASFFTGLLSPILKHFGLPGIPSKHNPILPIGISFYTFQAISYVIDVYRRKLPAEKKLKSYFLYILFFPQLIAGPIEKAKAMLTQFATKRSLTDERFHKGVELILWGLLKKLVIAGNIAVYVDVIFKMEKPSTLFALVGAFGFGIQIFADFSGYTDIARGSAKLLGIDLSKNFNFPYFARSPADFWKRWHITLGIFVRDYIYIPLGGREHGRIQNFLTLLATWAIMGLWHGGSWNFLIWGVYHGLLVAVYRLMVEPLNDQIKKSRIFRIFSITLTYLLINFGWLAFRTQKTKTLLSYFAANARTFSADEFRNVQHFLLAFLIYSTPFFFGYFLNGILKKLIKRNLENFDGRILYYTAIGLFIIIFRGIAYDFIYFQF
jgi:alginate O-acetyltransferase complex protein AlgI